MAKQVKANGHVISIPTINSSYQRRCLQFANQISAVLKHLNVDPEDVDVPMQVPIKNVRASARWYFAGNYLTYSYAGCTRFIDNLFVVSKVIALEVAKLQSGEISQDSFVHLFDQEDNHDQQREEAYEILGIEPGTTDLDVINNAYKKLARKYHPDMPEADTEKFKAVNKAHKLLKKELM